MERKIHWESMHYDYNPVKNSLSKEEERLEFTQDEENTLLQLDELVPVQEMSMTPFGLWKIDDSFHPMKQFKFWMGHTNFSIGESSKEIIKKTAGVEVLRIISRYRFIIAIGTLFDTTQVKLDIQQRVCGLDVKDISLNDGKRLSIILDELKSNFKDWCIYIFPNASYDYAGTNIHNDIMYEEKKASLLTAYQYSNGIFLTSKTKCNLI